MSAAEPPDRGPGDGAGRDDALGRLGRELERDAAEADALAPLVDDAAALQAHWRQRLRLALPLLLLLALGALLLLSGWHRELSLERIGAQQREISQWVRAAPFASAALLTLAIALTVATGVPGGVVLVVAGGAFLGALPTTLLASVGNTLGAAALYYATRRVLQHPGGRAPALVERLRAGFQRHPVSFTYFVRIAPVFPYGPASIALAWLGCRPGLFLAATALGSLPSSAIYAGVGAGLAHTVTTHRQWSAAMLIEPRILVPLALLALLTLLPALPGLLQRARGRSRSP